MSVINSKENLCEQIERAVQFADKTFGDGHLLVERYVDSPRHIEVQIFGDEFGNVVHLFERECSLQRRHQKIIEEAPAHNLPDKIRNEILKAAVVGAKNINYINAGTFEFLVTQDSKFYFLEANTRLQVEHTVTEEITGFDMIAWQLMVASKSPLPCEQSEIFVKGHAIECRIYAENPIKDFCPSPGTAHHVSWPVNLRVDAAFENKGAVPSFYDPMVAKLIASGDDRKVALNRLQKGLIQTSILGLTTNIEFLIDLLSDPCVIKGHLHTQLVNRFVQTHSSKNLDIAAIACAAAIENYKTNSFRLPLPWHGTVGPLDRLSFDSKAPFGQLTLTNEDASFEVRLMKVDANQVIMEIEGRTLTVTIRLNKNFSYAVYEGQVNGLNWTGLKNGPGFELMVSGRRMQISAAKFGFKSLGASKNILTASVPGVISHILFETGDQIAIGDTIVIVEAMKMENRICSNMTGSVKEIRCQKSDIVESGQVVAVLSPESPESAESIPS